MIGAAFYGLFVYLVWTNVKPLFWRYLLCALLVIWIVLIGFSRIYLRVHYATDVVAGYAIGLVWLFLSLYLLMALGLKGGFALAASGFTAQVLSGLTCAIVLAIVVPLIGWRVLRRLVAPFDAAALAAAYGSVSAVTFVTATHVLEANGIPFGGHMAAAMALMEAPAIVLAVLLANTVRHRMATPVAVVSVGPSGAATLPMPAAPPGSGTSMGRIVHESLTDGAQVLLLGSMLVGFITGEAGQTALQPFAGDLFKGMLSFFLLDMGLSAARKIPALRQQSPRVLVYAVSAPPLHALLAHIAKNAIENGFTSQFTPRVTAMPRQ